MIGTIVLFIFVYLYDLQTITFTVFTNMNALISGLIACTAFMLVIHEFGIQTSPGKAWFFLLVGIFLWWVGDLVWALYDIFLPEEELFPSPGDYAYFVGYFFMWGALLYQLRIFPSRLTKKEKLLIMGIILVIFVIFLVFLIIPILQYPISDEFTYSQLFFSLWYPLGDLIIAGIVLTFLFKLQGGEYVKVYRLISIAFLLYVLVDFLFSWFEWQEILNSSMIYDNFYVISSLILGGAGLVMREMLRKKDV